MLISVIAKGRKDPVKSFKSREEKERGVEPFWTCFA